MFIKTLFSDPRLFFSQLLIVVFSICLHEYIHTLTAYKLGDSTAADRGHLTLNPLKQMGFISLFMLCMLGLAWGQVPVDPVNFRRRSSDLRISLAGPLTNLALAVVMLVLCAILLACEVENFRALRMIFYGYFLFFSFSFARLS